MTSFFSAIGSLSYDGPESLGEIFLKIALGSLLLVT